MSLLDDKKKTLLRSLAKVFVGIDDLYKASNKIQEEVSVQIELDKPLRVDDLEKISTMSQSISDTLHDVRFEYEEMIWEMERQANHDTK